MEVKEEFRFKCPCTNPFCDLGKKLQQYADILGISLQTSLFILSTLEGTASASPIKESELQQLASRVLKIVGAIQDKDEVKAGFNGVILDCCRIACIVCEYAKNHALSPIAKGAIVQVILELKDIEQFAFMKNQRGCGAPLAAGKIDTDEWQMLLTIFYWTFAENKSKSDDDPDVANLGKKIFEQMLEKSKGNAAKEYLSKHAQSRSATKVLQPEQWGGHPQQNDQLRHPQVGPQAADECLGSEFHHGQICDDPQMYDGQQDPQDPPPQYQRYPNNSMNPFRMQIENPVRPQQPQYFPGHYAHGHRLGNPVPYGDNGQWYAQSYPPLNASYQPIRAPQPSHGAAVNHIGSVKNANFGDNHGPLYQYSY